MAVQCYAQPTAIGPKDYIRLRQQTSFSSDWSDTDLFDLKRPITIVVTIEGLQVPEVGNAELLFTPDSLPGKVFGERIDPDQVQYATLQMTQEVERLNLDRGRLRAGTRARITGWPATDINISASILLVDEIELLHSGEKFALHDYPQMVQKKKQLTSGADDKAPDSRP